MALRRHGFPSQNALAQELGISRSTTSKFFAGKPVDYSYFVEISERLGLDWQAIAYIQEDSAIKVEPAPPLEKPPEEKRENEMLEIDWRQICRDMLQSQNQKRLTTNPLTAGDGVAFELDEIHVSLGLVKRKYRSRLVGDVSPEQGSRIYEPEDKDEIVDTLQQDEFFKKKLSPVSRQKRIAIIGEPGAGKTTLLQKIAAWVLDNTPDVPIWISLADLQGKSIEQYLLSDWLKAATRKVRVTDAMQDALGELFNSNQVWLLLDGVDEMVMGTQSHTPLQWIANQFTGWVGNAQVVLTCRLNLWDVGKNALEAFETYRNLDFSYGDVQTSDQVGQFIRRWFQGSPHLDERLRAELNQPGKERIKDTVKNPLRLALLCRSWALGQGKLPNTKARLYQQFTEAVYEWKKDRFSTNSSQRQELNRALGELALKAISDEKTKFRLRHHFVCSVLGEPDTALFRLALQLGWLNQVGVAAEAEDLGENVYAFYHPTFQEYFAALAIEDWHYFLNHSRDNLAQGTYRIFEPQWKEVILLWLGRGDVVKEQKESFLKALIEFEDECKDFYRYQAYFLAAAGISEFGDCGRASEIVDQIIEWSFGYFNVEKQEWKTFIEPIEDNARTTLTETQTSLAIAALAQLISSTQDESVRRQAAFSLGKIDPGNQEAIKVIVELISSTEDIYIHRQADFRLRKISPGNQEAIKVLMEIISSAKDESILSETAFRLGQIDPGNQEAIKVLAELISSTEDRLILNQADFRLRKISPGNQEAIKILMEIISSTKDESIRSEKALRLGQIDPGNQEAIKILMEIISSTKDEFIRSETALRLGQIDPSNQEAIKVLMELISSTEDKPFRSEALSILREIRSNNQETINKVMVELISSTKDESVRSEMAFKLWQLYPSNQETIKVLMELISSTKDESVRSKMALRLWEIDLYDDQEAIKVLVELLSSAKNESVRSETALRLWQIDRGNQETIKVLVELLSSAKDESVRSETAFKLWQIDRGNQEATKALVQEAIKVLVELLSSAKDESVRIETAFRLGQIDPGNQEAIKILVELLSSAKDESVRIETAFRLLQINRFNQDVIKVLVELISSTKDELVRIETAFKLWKIDRGNQDVIKVLVELISSTKDEFIRKQAAFRLEEIKSSIISPKGGKNTKINPYELHLAFKGINPIDTNTNLIRLFNLMMSMMSSNSICGVSRIGQAKPEMIRTLVQLIGSSEDESARKEAIQYLRRIGTDNIRDEILPQLIHLLDKSPEKEYKHRVSDSLAVAALVQLIESSENESARIEATESLGKMGRGNPEAIAALMQLIKPTENEPTSLQEDKSIRRQAVYSLKKILRDDQLAGVVTDLKNYLSDEIYKNDTEQFEESYKLIWHCAQIMSYPDFFLAWQNEPTLL
jgi:HEAT repeat protein/DNA replication protein DnaC